MYELSIILKLQLPFSMEIKHCIKCLKRKWSRLAGMGFIPLRSSLKIFKLQQNSKLMTIRLCNNQDLPRMREYTPELSVLGQFH